MRFLPTKVFLSFTAILLASLPGCGGGSRGTGGITVDGTLIDSRSIPLPGVEVRVAQGTAEDVTDENGEFEIHAEDSSSVEVIFFIDGQQVTSALVDIPPGTAIVTTIYQVDDDGDIDAGEPNYTPHSEEDEPEHMRNTSAGSASGNSNSASGSTSSNRPNPQPTPTPVKTGSNGGSLGITSGISRPTETPEASDRPHRVETPEPSETAEPSETPEPTETPEPSETPEASETPEPSETPKIKH